MPHPSTDLSCRHYVDPFDVPSDIQLLVDTIASERSAYRNQVREAERTFAIECVIADRERRTSETIVREARKDERSRCLADVDYVLENIVVNEGRRRRFDIRDMNQTFRNACRFVRERIAGDDDGKRNSSDRAEPSAHRPS